MSLPAVTLVLGGTRSGKSAYAERLILDSLVGSRLLNESDNHPPDELVIPAKAGIHASASRHFVDMAESRRNMDPRLRGGDERGASTARPAIYLATAQADAGFDAEMDRRIRQHQERRGAAWRTIEEPLALAETLRRHDGQPILVECLTLWLSNLMEAGRDIEFETQVLVEALSHLNGPVVMVSSEVGQGIVPDNALARAFRDHAGRLHQRVAAVAGRVALVVAGLPLMLKESPSP